MISSFAGAGEGDRAPTRWASAIFCNPGSNDHTLSGKRYHRFIACTWIGIFFHPSLVSSDLPVLTTQGNMSLSMQERLVLLVVSSVL